MLLPVAFVNCGRLCVGEIDKKVTGIRDTPLLMLQNHNSVTQRMPGYSKKPNSIVKKHAFVV